MSQREANDTKHSFLILGANSFSGASFVRHLRKKNCTVIATSRSKQPDHAFVPYLWDKNGQDIIFERLDLNSEDDSLENILDKYTPTHVVNFAAQSMVGESWLHPQDWMRTNVYSTVRLHETLRNYKNLRKYVQVTTPEVYGSTEGWVSEHRNFNPSTPYAVSRAASDMSLQTYIDRYDFPAVMTRAANVFGSGQQLYRIIPRTILAAMTGEVLTLDGGGASTRVFTHIDDVCDATYRVAVHGTNGETYHISGTNLISIRDCVKLIFNVMEVSFEKLVEVGPERPGKDGSYKLDSSKIRAELGWSDTVLLEDGIKTTIQWLAQFKNKLDHLPKTYSHKP